jgi:hypothetical protein
MDPLPKGLLEIIQLSPAEITDQEPLFKNKCYTCVPRGTMKDHIISHSENFTFNHDTFRRPLIIICSVKHYHTIYDMPDHIKVKLFNDIKQFVEFWNLTLNYQLMINNGNSQTHHHFHIKMKIDDSIAKRMRRDHFTRINLQKTYESNIKNEQ